jgi:hypothetical protein
VIGWSGCNPILVGITAYWNTGFGSITLRAFGIRRGLGCITIATNKAQRCPMIAE